jgi:hypothetical protein
VQDPNAETVLSPRSRSSAHSPSRSQTHSGAATSRPVSGEGHIRARLDALHKSQTLNKVAFHYPFKSHSATAAAAVATAPGGALPGMPLGVPSGGTGGGSAVSSLHIQQLFGHIETVGQMALAFTARVTGYLQSDPPVLVALHKQSAMCVRAALLAARALVQQIDRDLAANRHRIELVSARRRDIRQSLAQQQSPDLVRCGTSATS